MESTRVEGIINASRIRVERRREILRSRRFGNNGSQLPYPLIRMDDDQAALFKRGIDRTARKEQMGQIKGDAASQTQKVLGAGNGELTHNDGPAASGPAGPASSGTAL